MTDKEKIELINLRNRLRSQREEIKRLTTENAELKNRLSDEELNMKYWRSRCVSEKELFHFDNRNYGHLKIVGVGHGLVRRS